MEFWGYILHKNKLRAFMYKTFTPLRCVNLGAVLIPLSMGRYFKLTQFLNKN